MADTVDTAAYDAWQRKLDARRKQAGKAPVTNPFVRYSVPCVRLTALLTALRLPRVDIMWLDVEGALRTQRCAAVCSSVGTGGRAPRALTR